MTSKTNIRNLTDADLARLAELLKGDTPVAAPKKRTAKKAAAKVEKAPTEFFTDVIAKRAGVKPGNRDLAAHIRTLGVEPNGEAWKVAKAGGTDAEIVAVGKALPTKAPAKKAPAKKAAAKKATKAPAKKASTRKPAAKKAAASDKAKDLGLSHLRHGEILTDAQVKAYDALIETVGADDALRAALTVTA